MSAPNCGCSLMQSAFATLSLTINAINGTADRLYSREEQAGGAFLVFPLICGGFFKAVPTWDEEDRSCPDSPACCGVSPLFTM